MEQHMDENNKIREEKIKKVEEFLDKEKDKSFKKGMILGIVITVVVFLVLNFGTSVFNGYKAIDHDLKLKSLEKMVEKNYLFGDDINKDKAKEATYKGYIESLGDPYSEYMTKAEYKQVQKSLKGEIYGIGVVFTLDFDNGVRVPTVVRVMEGYAADKAGIKSGDIITKVDGKGLEDMSQTQMSQHIQGPKGSKVKVSIFRPSTEKEFTKTLTRQEIKVETVHSEVLENNIGYIEVSEFSENTDEDFIKEVDALKEKKVNGIVIDLRNNPGGLLDSCTKMLDYLLPEGRLVTIKQKDGTEQKIDSDAKEINIPISIIVNKMSASASELFTGAMQDFDRATVVGTQTFGKGIVQNIYPFKDGSALKLTIAEYLTPDNRHIHKKGITPDIKVKDTREDLLDKNDAQLKAAIKALKK